MPLHLALAATLGFLTFLSTLMLGLGQSNTSLPILVGIGAVASFILTDYRRIIQLGDWTVNGFAVLIVCFNIADVLQNRGEDLAWSIARVLVFIQVVLLFREKEPRFCWQILMISMLQVVVATVFQQSIMFGALLLLYVFVGLCVFILLFLQQEHRYFRRHSFVRTFSEAIRSEMTERQDRQRLARIALMTLLMGPLSLVLSFGKRKTDENASLQKTQTQKQLRSLFLIFPTEEDLAQKERWESIDDPSASETTTHTEPAAPFHAVPNRSENVDSSFTFSRFPLLTERPGFSAGTQNPRPWNGRWRELFLHLTTGTFFAFFVAALLFCLIPRVGKIEFYDLTLKPGFERWMRPTRQFVNVGTVGMNEEIQLGSLGTVIPHHREVMKVRFLHRSDNQLLLETDRSTYPYREIVGATLYFFGSPLDAYSEGLWTQQSVSPPAEWTPPDWQRDEENDYGEYSLEEYTELFRTAQFAMLPIFGVLQIGTMFPLENLQNVFFEAGADLVTLAMEVKPLDSQVFFAPHPFFCLEKPREIGLQNVNGRIEERRQFRRREMPKTIVCTGFKHGVQLDLIPCQEWINLDDLLQVPKQGLESLQALATKWDVESKCAKDDVVGRARYMEQQFLRSPEFSYQLGGIVRDYDLDPLEDFIAHNPKGHCEYFAGALALMLRSVGIGSRVILGFKTEVRDFHASCTIRQSDAHAWVEVYIPVETIPYRVEGQYAHWWYNGGWLRLDPTPAPNDSLIVKALALQWADWYYYTQAFWNEYVVNMTQSKQAEWVYQPISLAWNYIVYRVCNLEFWRHLYFDMMRYYQSFFSDTPQHKRQMWDGFYLLPPFIILGLIGFAGWRLMPVLQSSIRKRSSDDMRRRITIEFYLRMERMLAKIGLIRQSSLTPLEFARQAPFAPLMLPVVEAFYRVRFGHVTLTEEESKSVLKTLDQLEHSIKEHESK